VIQMDGLVHHVVWMKKNWKKTENEPTPDADEAPADATPVEPVHIPVPDDIFDKLTVASLKHGSIIWKVKATGLNKKKALQERLREALDHKLNQNEKTPRLRTCLDSHTAPKEDATFSQNQNNHSCTCLIILCLLEE